MGQLTIPEEAVRKALFDIIGAYKIICKIERSALPDNRVRARGALTLIEMGIDQFKPLLPNSVAEVLQREIDARQNML